MEGKVIKSVGNKCKIKTKTGDIINGILKGKFRIKNIKTTNPIAVGDIVSFTINKEGLGIIEKIKPRLNNIKRKATKLSKTEHILASNIDQIMVIVSMKNPKITLGFVDRVLISADYNKIPVFLIFNKYDIYEKKDINTMLKLQKMYKINNVLSLVASAKTGIGGEELIERLKNKTTLFFGQSGVGKSSLLKSINPNLDLQIKTISAYNNKGKHSTTFAELYELIEKTEVIDTPGVRSFGIVNIEKQNISHHFPEIFKASKSCRFSNCIHINEPDCAVIKNVENKTMLLSRYNNYIQIYNEMK